MQFALAELLSAAYAKVARGTGGSGAVGTAEALENLLLREVAPDSEYTTILPRNGDGGGGGGGGGTARLCGVVCGWDL